MATDKIISHDGHDAARFMLSANPKQAIQDMMDTIDALRALYVEENDALDQADTKTFLSLQDRKIILARHYQDGAQQIVARRAELEDHITVDFRNSLHKKQEEFSEITSHNLIALERMRKSTQRLGNRIIQAARDAVRMEAPAYSARGQLESGERPVSIGLNESA